MAEPVTASFIPKAPARFSTQVVSVGGAWLFNLALVAFVASLVPAGGLFAYDRSLASTRADWEEQVQGQEAELRPDLLAQIADLSSAIGVSRALIASHVYASNSLL